MVHDNRCMCVSVGNALKQNFVFDSLGEMDIKTLVQAMEIVSVAAGDTVITQGADIFFQFYTYHYYAFSVIRGRGRLFLHH